MLEILHHRGPDASGVFNDKYTWLGHNRLSIIDVSELGNQPMKYKSFVITYNGEIYSVDNISIGRMYKQIPVYELPKSKDSKLTSDPKKGIISKLDLKEIKEIRVQHPSTIWHFQQSDAMVLQSLWQ